MGRCCSPSSANSPRRARANRSYESTSHAGIDASPCAARVRLATVLAHFRGCTDWRRTDTGASRCTSGAGSHDAGPSASASRRRTSGAASGYSRRRRRMPMRPSRTSRVTRASADGSRKSRCWATSSKTDCSRRVELLGLPARHRRKIGFDLPAADLTGLAHRFGEAHEKFRSRSFAAAQALP